TGTTINIVSDATGGNNCAKTFTRTWDATDNCENHSATVSQTITVRDVTAPAIGSAGANFSVAGCPNSTDPNTLGWQPPTANDACNGATVNTVSTVSSSGGACAKIWTRTWNA